ncbi:MAG: nitroreductase family deazaflavin-dependent oxidoreductase [Actinomycetota bacterium]|nr:nitroreductase family deazaflavin-dependent oxidoreductase [Actinomycetota bacterium]
MSTGEERRYIRPGPLVTGLGNPVMKMLGFAPTLVVRGRKSGAWRTTPVMPLRVEKVTYLVSPRGETDWVRNLRAAGEGQLRRFSRTRAFRAAEVPPTDRARFVEAYKRRWARTGPIKAQFDNLPNPTDHPVFRLTFH